MKTRFRKAEKRVLIVEGLMVSACVILSIFGIAQIIDGSLVAVVWTTAAALIASMIGEDMQRIFGEAKRRDNTRGHA